MLLSGVCLQDGEIVDIVVSHGRIDKVVSHSSDQTEGTNPTVRRADALLALPAFVDLHLHLDKAFTYDKADSSATSLEGAIESLHHWKKEVSVETVAEGAIRAMRSSVATGTTRMRTHVDIDPIFGLKGLLGVQYAHREYSEFCELQIVAFPQQGLARERPTKLLLERALEEGAHLVGGMPHGEVTLEEQREHVSFCFALAAEAGVDVDMHVDESDDGDVRTLELVADETMARGWEGRVTVGHACALAAADDAYAAKVIAKCVDSGVTLVVNPGANLVLLGRGDRGLVRRGLTRLSEFRAAGVPICFGQDNVCDPFYPFGRGDMLEVAFLAAHAAHLVAPEDLMFLLDAVTDTPARVWGGGEVMGVRTGARADIVMYRADSWRQALRLQEPPELVLARGRRVARQLRCRKP